MSNGVKLRTELAAFPCTASAFSVLAVPPLTSRRLTQQKLSAISANQDDFSSPTEAAEFFGVIEAMKKLEDHVTPRVPINWSDLRVKDALLRVFERQKNELDPVHRQVWVIRLSLHDYFKGLRSDNSIISTLNYHHGDAAVFTDYKLAGECVELLKQLNVPAKTEFFTAERRQSTITMSLEELGFE